MSNKKTKKPYEKRVRYHFECAHENWAILSFDAISVYFEETRKNGQEDTHMSGEAEFKDGKWVLEEDTRKEIAEYLGKSTPGALERYFNKHGMPASNY